MRLKAQGDFHPTLVTPACHIRQTHNHSGSIATHPCISASKHSLPQRRSLKLLKLSCATAAPAPAADTTAEAATAAGLTIQPATSLAQYQATAALRAEAYYAEDRSRFVESYKKKFAGQETESLQLRTAILKDRDAPLVDCLVAISPEGQVIGCIDVRLPYAVTGVHPLGVPRDEVQACYICSLVVAESHRNQGIGRSLMRAATQRALQKWRASRLYTNVDADNDAALHLYTSMGFIEFSADKRFESALKLGQTLLLCATPETLRLQ